MVSRLAILVRHDVDHLDVDLVVGWWNPEELTSVSSGHAANDRFIALNNDGLDVHTHVRKALT